MADVLVPASPSTMTMLHPQDPYQAVSTQPINNSRVIARGTRNSMYYGQPIPQYQFQSAPILRHDARAQFQRHSLNHYMRVADPDSSSSTASSASSSSNQSARYALSKDDSVVGMKQRQGLRDVRVSSNAAASLSTPDLTLAVSQDVVKPSPDRYRRSAKRDAQAEANKQRPSSSMGFSPAQDKVVLPSKPQIMRHSSYDDSALVVSSRYKRRSFVGGPETFVPPTPVTTAVNASGLTWSQVVTGRHNIQGPLPPPQHVSRNLAKFRPMSMNDLRAHQQQQQQQAEPVFNRHSSYGMPRSQLVDGRPMTAPMALSRPATNPVPPLTTATSLVRPSTAGPGASPSVQPAPSSPVIEPASPEPASPAVQRLSALNGKAVAKGIKSRLRRTFSFGSSQDLQRASAENNVAAERAKLRKEHFNDEVDSKDAAIAAEQEAAGMGSQIYTNQGQFAASTDNISISSTASSASIMLRKVGRGVKRSTRNLRNLFRPKSIISSPEADSVMDSTPDLRRSIEAERERVNVNLDPHDKPGGGTGYPRLEKNSMEIAPSAVEEALDEGSRRSIIGGDRERAEVLAAVRKGILKRAGTSSSSSSPPLPQGEIKAPGDASLPATPTERQSEEYFDAPPFRPGAGPSGSTRSLPTAAIRNISFNSRVQFFDVWSPSEYDRRGDIATCNRLTPMLAQQIKEELNSFKMEMEVHEDSKPHTHFF